ncbi:hypothetical protein LGT39_04875 [Demequina sp. TTPB684]|uniref:hypothetical protein n=1 Tax=unclassified Demequina TaxID=2620311 RepID=UPI001CF559D3|nr:MULTISPECIES: hypothetical protein [unclassified Demequina]MCB2412183.1 hypothetical protein [Demequina sp. TTPB684]UPU88392.1 hypothetical protein LGT36_000245 [Demequina sp. TMPB413]
MTAGAEPEISEAAEAVQAIDAIVGGLRADAVGVVDANAEVVASDTVVEFSADALDGIAIGVDGAPAIEVTLPFADAADEGEIVDGALVYDNNNGSTTTPLVHDDGSVQILTTIADSTAPTDYEYDLTLGQGSSLSIAPDGGVVVKDSEGAVVGVVEKPWAFDATGSPVSTHYVVDGDTLVQVVAHDSSTIYPVVADPSISFGWAIYVKYSKADVKTVTSGLGGAINDNAEFGLILCGKIPHWAAKAGCALVGKKFHTSIYNTFKDAKANNQCVEVQLAYISYLPVSWKRYSC